ncbi:MAG: hypothetical protein IID37_07620 [Planctomycetes bacterium]|nr:hypothetical protein [Planctomycetota bacterium]
MIAKRSWKPTASRELAMRSALGGFIALCSVSSGLAQPAGGDPGAIAPLPRPFFSIDIISPTILAAGLAADDVLTVDGDGLPPPAIVIAGMGLGLGMPGDDIDGLSGPNSAAFLPRGSGTPIRVLLFTVSRGTVGGADPILDGFPFNAKEQAAKNQAAGDEFLALTPFDAAGPLGSPRQNNTLAGNQADVGGVDGANMELLPDFSPLIDATGMEIDAVNAVFRPGSSATLGPVFFSLTSTSPSLGVLPGLGSGADVYVDVDPELPGTESAYIVFPDIGLLFDDDIDALTVMDDGDNVFDPTVDRILFSLAAGSPSLFLLGVSPAHILTTATSGGDPPIAVFVSAVGLGLLETDEVGAMDMFPASNFVTLICNSAIGIGDGCCEGDANADGTVDPLDGGYVLARFGCPVGTGDLTCDAADVNGDGNVDPLDSGFVLARFGPCPTTPPTGACCFPDDGACEIQTALGCVISGGVYAGNETTCEPDVCKPFSD